MGSTKALSSGLLGLMIVAIVASLQIMTACAVYGYALITFYAIAALTYFFPSMAIACELSTSYPVTGGSYIWVEKAFGKRWGFFTVCIQWLCNLIWYPTIFSLIATAAFYLYDPALAQNKALMFWTVLGMFWTVTFLNAFGIKVSSWASSLCAVVGVILPILLLIGLAVYWVLEGHPTQIHLSWASLNPSLTDTSHFAFLSQVVISLIGLEVALVHMGDVHEPHKTVPRALIYAGAMVLVLVIGAPLAIAQILPASEISVVSGLLDTFTALFYKLGLPASVLAAMMGMIFIGNFGCVTAWMIGSTRGMHVASGECHLPAIFRLTNRFKAPLGILILEGIAFTLLTCVLTCFPTLGDGYWFLLILACQVCLTYYLLIFAAVIALRNKLKTPLAYRIPGGNWGIWVAAGLASLTVLTAIIVGFFPPSDGSVHFEGSTYTLMLLCGIAVACTIPWLLLGLAKKKA
jgi:amino acid transporter